MISRGKVYAPAALNRRHPLSRGLAAFYLALPGRAAGSTWYDLCGFNHVSLASLSAGYGFQPSPRPGGCGSALKLDGTATCRRTASAPISGLPCTFACWYAPAVTTAEYGLISIDDGTSSNQIGMEQYISKIGVFLNAGSGEVYSSTTIGVANTWNFATATIAQGTLYAYLNGANKSIAGSSALTPTGLNTVRIGGNAFTSTKLAGQIDCALIYNRALADAEILALYLETMRGCPSLLRWVNRPPLGFPVGGKFKPEQLAFSPMTGIY
jgi:hypothetical protein